MRLQDKLPQRSPRSTSVAPIHWFLAVFSVCALVFTSAFTWAPQTTTTDQEPSLGHGKASIDGTVNLLGNHVDSADYYVVLVGADDAPSERTYSDVPVLTLSEGAHGDEGVLLGIDERHAVVEGTVVENAIPLVAWTSVDADGTFALSGLEPGKYRAALISEDPSAPVVWYEDAKTLDDSKTLDLGSEEQLTWSADLQVLQSHQPSHSPRTSASDGDSQGDAAVENGQSSTGDSNLLTTTLLTIEPRTPTIGGRLAVNQTLTARPGTWVPADVTFAYQWQRNGVNIPGATASTYKVLAADQDRDISVSITGSKTGYRDKTATSDAVTIPRDTSAPVIVKSSVALSNDNLAAGDAVVTVRVTIKDDLGVDASSVVLHTSSDRTDESLGFGRMSLIEGTIYEGVWEKTVRIPSSSSPGSWTSMLYPLSDLAGNTGWFADLETFNLYLGVLTAPTPTIEGDPKVGMQLSAKGAGTSDFTPRATSVSYQWLRNGTAISGANKETYTLQGADHGQQISVRVNGSRTDYKSAQGTSTSVTPAAGSITAGTPTITGTPTVGQTLTANPGTWQPQDVTLNYQWQRNATNINGATNNTYKLTTTDANTNITVQITGTLIGADSVTKSGPDVQVSPLPVGPNKPNVTRLADGTRYGTNRAVNGVAGIKGGPVFIATGTGFADALSIGPVVRMLGGSLFLTAPNSVEPKTLDAIRRLTPSSVYIVGGTGAVSQQVASQVGAATGKTPQRVSGANRYATSEAIFNKFFASRVVSSVFIATGRDYPDALSAAAAGGALSAPVLLVDGVTASGVSSGLTASLKAKGTNTVLIAGGTGAVNARIESSLKRSFGDVNRLAGSTRYGTNYAINNYLTQMNPDVALDSVWLATGRNFPDALSAAAPAGTANQRLVLSNLACIPKPVVSDWITKPGSSVSNVYLVGGTGVLTPSVQRLEECK